MPACEFGIMYLLHASRSRPACDHLVMIPILFGHIIHPQSSAKIIPSNRFGITVTSSFPSSHHITNFNLFLMIRKWPHDRCVNQPVTNLPSAWTTKKRTSKSSLCSFCITEVHEAWLSRSPNKPHCECRPIGRTYINKKGNLWWSAHFDI